MNSGRRFLPSRRNSAGPTRAPMLCSFSLHGAAQRKLIQADVSFQTLDPREAHPEDCGGQRGRNEHNREKRFRGKICPPPSHFLCTATPPPPPPLGPLPNLESVVFARLCMMASQTAAATRPRLLADPRPPTLSSRAFRVAQKHRSATGLCTHPWCAALRRARSLERQQPLYDHRLQIDAG